MIGILVQVLQLVQVNNSQEKEEIRDILQLIVGIILREDNNIEDICNIWGCLALLKR